MRWVRPMTAVDEGAAAPQVVRVARATIVIFSILFGPFLAASIVLLWRSEQVRESLLFGAVYVAALYWMCGRSVELLPPSRGVQAQGIRSRRRRLSLGRRPTGSDALFPVCRLERGVQSVRREAVLARGVAAILQHIRNSNPTAEFDPIAADMSAGDLESITRETLSARNLLLLVLTAAAPVLGAALGRTLLR